MYLDRKRLAFLQLANSKAEVYRAPSSTKGFVQNVTLHNTGSSAETVTLYYDDGTSEHQWLSQSIAGKDSFILDISGEGFVVSPEARITGSADTASTVTCELSGVEEYDASVGAKSNLWFPPSSPHPQDDEFDGGSLGDWGVQQTSTNVPASFSIGAIDAYDSSFGSGNVLRVSYNVHRPSWLMMQPHGGAQTFTMYKPFTLPTNLLMWARMSFNKNDVALYNNDSWMALQFLTDQGDGTASWPYNVTVFLNEADSGQTQAQAQYHAGGSSAGIVENTSVGYEGQALEYGAIHKIGSTYHVWVGTTAGNWIWMNSYALASFTPNMVGFSTMNQCYDCLYPGPAVHGIDFIRFIETDNFVL